MTFADKLQELRKSKGFSQEDLAEKCNVSRQSVSKWETGQGYPETEKLLLLCEILNVNLDYLLRDKTIEIDTKIGDAKEFIDIPYVGRWVKIFLKDKEFNGFYRIALIDIRKSNLMFMDDKGKKGLLDLSSVVSISDADIYKNKKQLEKLPPIQDQELSSEHNLLNYFIEKSCNIKLKQEQMGFTKPGGFYAVNIKSITDETITVLDVHGSRSTLKLSDILFIKEH